MTNSGARVVDLEKRVATLEEQLTRVHFSLLLMQGTPTPPAPQSLRAHWADELEPQEERE